MVVGVGVVVVDGGFAVIGVDVVLWEEALIPVSAVKIVVVDPLFDDEYVGCTNDVVTGGVIVVVELIGDVVVVDVVVDDVVSINGVVDDVESGNICCCCCVVDVSI